MEPVFTSFASPPHPDEFHCHGIRDQRAGNIVEDAQDLYRVMTLAWEQVKDRIKVSEFYLTGYSLGGPSRPSSPSWTRAARLQFKKVLMINPAVSLYTSAKILDDMLLQINPTLPGGVRPLVRRALAQFAAAYKLLHEPHSTMTSSTMPTGFSIKKAGRPTGNWRMIGTVFRLASSNMIFTADVMANYG